MKYMKQKESLLTKLKTKLDSQQLVTRMADLGYRELVPYHVISGPELAKVLGVSGQTLANWRMRGIGPRPEPSEEWRGHRNYYLVAEILSYFTGKSRTDIYCDWIRNRFSHYDTESVEGCQSAIRELIRLKIFPQQKWKRKWRPHVPEFQIREVAYA